MNWRYWDWVDWTFHIFMCAIAGFVVVCLGYGAYDCFFREKPEWGLPYHQCLVSKPYTFTTFMKVGSVTVPQTHRGMKCVKESKDFYIDSKKGTYVLKLVDGEGDK